GELVHTRDRAATTDETVEVVAGIVRPGSAERRDGFTHREASELDEGVVHADRTSRDRASVGVVRSRAERGGSDRRVNGAAGAVASIGIGRPGEGRIEEGANHAVFGGGARIDVQVFTGTPGVGVGEAIVRCAGTRGVAGVDRVRIDRNFGAQVAAELDAGVRAGNVVEPSTVQGTDPHVFDRFGLYGKIGCLCPAHGDETRR